MAEAHTKYNEVEENEEQIFTRLSPDADSLRLHANYLAYLVHHPSLKCHP